MEASQLVNGAVLVLWPDGSFFCSEFGCCLSNEQQTAGCFSAFLEAFHFLEALNEFHLFDRNPNGEVNLPVVVPWATNNSHV